MRPTVFSAAAARQRGNRCHGRRIAAIAHDRAHHAGPVFLCTLIVAGLSFPSPGAEQARKRRATSLIRLFVAAAALCIAAKPLHAAEPRRVLLLHAFGHAYSPWSDMAASFRAELIRKSRDPIDLYEVSLDTARAQDQQQEGPFVDYIHALLSGRKPDLIVPIGAPAAFFVQRNRQALFAATPMLTVGADRRRISEAMLQGDSKGVLLDLDLPAYVENILRLRPETKEITIVVGNSPVERYWASELRRDTQAFADRVSITWFDGLTFAEMLARAATMPPASVIFWFLLSEDAAGVPYSEDRAFEAIREVANVPVFGMGDYQLGRGIVGGPLMQTQALGKQAADVGLRILNGESVRGINSPWVLFGTPVYDWRELRKWNINEALLPPGSVVHFREATLWEQYRWQVTAASAIVLLQTALIAGLLLERGRRQRATAQAGRATAESGRYRESLAHLVRVHTVGEMSTAIAHEVNQPLAAIKNYAFAARRRLSGQSADPKVEELLDKIEEQASRAGDVLHSLRAMVKKHESERSKTEVAPLVRDTLKLVEIDSHRAGIRLESTIAPDLPPVFVDGIQIQQVVLNLTRNAIEAMEESGHIGTVSIGVEGSGHGQIAVSVADTGPGIAPGDAERIFDPFYSTKVAGLGVGLSISRAIIEAHGGRLSLTPNAGGGSLFRFTLPAATEGV